MATFTASEIQYLKGQLLARLATTDAEKTPHVVPLGFRVSDDDAAIDVGGVDFSGSRKYRDMKANPRVAIVIDDLPSTDPWTPRGIEVIGTVELHATGGVGKFGAGRDEVWARIVPERVTSWGIEGHAFSREGGRRTRTVPRS